MKKDFKALVFSFIAIVFVAGVFLLFNKQNVVDSLSYRAEIPDLEIDPNLVSVSASDVIDIEILNSSKLNSLKNNVVNFDFDNVCHKPSSVIKVVSQSASSSASNASQIGSCQLGNGQPFTVAQKEE